MSGLGHWFEEGRPLFRGIDRRLDAGVVYAVTGPSGSGKSTLLGVLAGWIAPAEGAVERVGIERIGWVFQNPHGIARRAAVDHVALPFVARGATRAAAHARARDLMDEFGLSARVDAPFAALSGGEAQRLMLARGLASAPDLLLVDEPTAQLDQVTAAGVSDSLRAAAGRQCIVVVATHDQRTRAACTDEIDLTRSMTKDRG